MSGFFGFLAFLAFAAFVVGMYNPAIVVFWAKKKTRGKTCLYLAAMVVCIAIAGGGNNTSSVSKSPVATDSQVSSSSSKDSDLKKSDATSSASSHSSSAPVTKSYKDGMYKIGKDIKAGEYVIVPSSKVSGYFSLSSDSSGSFDSIIANDNFDGRRYVTLEDGQYLTLQRGIMYDLSSAPAVDASGNTLSEGMYKVGQDIQPGEYKIKSIDSTSAYMQVTSNSTHNMDSIVTNDNFSGEKYISVSNGQYLTIVRAQLILK